MIGGLRPRPRKLSAVSPRIMPGIDMRRGGDQVRHEAGDQMAADDAARLGAHQLGGQHVVLLAQREQFRAHGARQAGPVEQPEDHGDAEIDERSGLQVTGMIAASAIHSGMLGIDCRTSMMRCTMRSNTPPW